MTRKVFRNLFSAGTVSLNMDAVPRQDVKATIRGRNPTLGFRMILFAVALLSTLLGRAAGATTDFGGSYALADAKAGRAFTLEVKQTDSRAEVSFSAAMDDGSGSAPDGSGKGRIEDGVLTFKFKDSFNNEGTCTLTSAKHGYQLNMVVIKVVDPSPFHFYGNVALKKTSGRAP